MKKFTTMMAVMMVAMVCAFLVPREVEAAKDDYFDDFVDVDNLDDYLENYISEEVELHLSDNLSFYTEKYTGYVLGSFLYENGLDREWSYTIKNPVISKEEDKFVAYGLSTVNRKLKKIVATKEGIFENEEILMCIDFPSNKKISFIESSEYCTLGKYENTTKYAIFRDGAELATFDVGEELEFPSLCLGIAKGKKTGNAYLIRYASTKVEIEKLDENVHRVEQDYNYFGPGMCSYEKDGKRYLVKPSSENYLLMGRLPESADVNLIGTYTIIEDVPENYDYAMIICGTEDLIFHTKYGINIGGYTYFTYDDSPVSRDYVAVVANKDNPDYKEIYDYCFKEIDVKDLEKYEKKLEKFLENYEKTHADEIKDGIEKRDLSNSKLCEEISEEAKEFLQKQK